MTPRCACAFVAVLGLLLTSAPTPAAAASLSPPVAAPLGERGRATTQTVDHVDAAVGFALPIPASWQVDRSLGPVRAVFTADGLRFEVTVDDFTGSHVTAASVIGYGNSFARNRRDHDVTVDRRLVWGGRDVHLLQWSRRSLAHVANDLRHNTSIEIVDNPKRVATILIRSRRPVSDPLALCVGFRFIARDLAAVPCWAQAPSTTPMNEETRALLAQWFSSSSPRRIGIFQPGAPDDMGPVQQLEGRVGASFPVLLRYCGLGKPFPLAALRNAAAAGRVVELTLQTVAGEGVDANAHAGPATGQASTLYDLLDGVFDPFLRQYARGLKQFGRPVFFRLNNEMNGDWCWYSAYHAGKDAALFVEAWRHVHRLFAQEGVDNAIWVWNPHDRSFPPFAWNHPLVYYPGDEFVDVIGLTGYNNGTGFKGEEWREFADIYRPLVRDCAAWFARPLMITEFAASSVGGDKPAWIKRMWTALAELPQVKVAVWWNSTDYDSSGRPARLYRLDENTQTLAAFREGLMWVGQGR